MRHVVPAVVLVSIGCAAPALAEPMVQPKHGVYGCVDPRATTALAIPDGRLRNRKWVEYVHRTGHCVLLPASGTYEVLLHQGPLVLVKSPDAKGDAPPVYAQSSDLQAVADEAPAAAAPAAADQPPAEGGATPASAATTPPAAPAGSTPAAVSASEPASASTLPPAPPQEPATTAQPATETGQVPSQPATAAVPPAPGTPPAVATTPVSPPTPAASPMVAPPEPTASQPTTPAVSAPTATMPPVSDAAKPRTHGSSGVSVLAMIVVLALLGLIAAAVMIARQQRRFAHVEDADWQKEDRYIDPLASTAPHAPAGLDPVPTPQEFRRGCIEVLEQGGWTIQPSFAASATRDGAPDILARRKDALLAVRCQAGGTTITPDMIREVAAMGQQARAHVTVLATPAPMTRRAHDEAMRLHVHVLDAEELGGLSA